MNLSKIIAAGALATGMAFAQEDAWPTDEQTEEQAAEQNDDSATQQEEAVEAQEESSSNNVNTQANNQETNNNNNQNTNQVAVQNDYNDQPKSTLNDKAGVGIHGNFNYSFLYGLSQDWNMGDEEDAPAGIGFDFGFRGRIPMVNFLQFVPEINFHYAELSQQDETAERTFTQMDLEIPLTIRGVLMDCFYIAAGAQFTLNLSSDVKLEEADVDIGGGLGTLSMSFDEDIKQAGFGFGLVIGVGGIIMERLSIDASIVLGITSIYPDCDSELIDISDAKQMTFKVGAGFWFL